MKINKVITTIAFILVIIIVVILIKSITPTKQYSFFDEIERMNIASIEVVKNTTNDNVVSNDKNFIKNVTSILSDLELDNETSTKSTKTEEYYHIYISEVGYYPHPPIGVSEGCVEYHGKYYISAEKSIELINLLENELQK